MFINQKKTRIKLRNFIFFFILLCWIKVYSQNPEEYQKIYTKTYLDISQKDFQKSIRIADSLYKASETPHYKAKSLMLSASLFQQSGDIKKAVDYAIEADTVILGTDDYVWKAKISGFLATQYRNLGLYDKSKKYIDESLKAVNKIEDIRLVNQTMGFIMQEKAYYEIEMTNYQKALLDIKASQKYFNQTEQPNSFISANNDQLYGLTYYYLNQYDQALLHYNNGLKKIDFMPDNFLKATIYNGIAQVFIRKKDQQKAQENLIKAERIAEESPYLNLKDEVYKTSQQYYLLIRDIEHLKKAQIKQESVSEKIKNNSLEFISNSYNILENKNQEIATKSANKNIIVVISLIFLSSLFVYIIIYRKKQKQKFMLIKAILESKIENQILDHQPSLTNSNNGIFDSDENDGETIFIGSAQQILMTPATEKKLLSKLEQFEQAGLFTKNMVSLPYVASYCKTNTKYLSYVINNHKQKDFKNYINELRIRYIIEKLKTDPQYQKYKISTLSEEVGFSSQSKFAAAFKKVTNVSPSEFLQHMKNERYDLITEN